MKSIFIFIILISATACKNNTKKVNHIFNPQKVTVPFNWGFNNDNFPSSNTIIDLFDPLDSLIFRNSGYKPFWGLQPKGLLKLTGKYKVHIIYFLDSVTKKDFNEYFEINGSENKIDLVVNLMSFGQRCNEVYVTKYYDNQYKIRLKRLWNPQEQFASKKELLPDYEWNNPSDSAIYGIYHRLSSSSMISWIQNWNIAYMNFQQYSDSGWLSLSCNAPRIEAELKKGQTGKTLKDMVLSCSKDEFKKNNRYRILIEYGINDAICRWTKSSNNLDSSFYYEPHIYEVADEFTVK